MKDLARHASAKAIGVLLRGLREGLEMSRQDFANAILRATDHEWTANTVMNYEKAENGRAMDFFYLLDVCVTFDKPFSWLLGVKEPTPIHGPHNTRRADIDSRIDKFTPEQLTALEAALVAIEKLATGDDKQHEQTRRSTPKHRSLAG